MTYQLRAARYANSDSGPELLEQFDSVAALGIRCSKPGWVQRIELTVRASNRFDEYDRYSAQIGQRIIIHDQWIDRPVASGRIHEIIPNNGVITYICAGHWKDHFRDLDTTSYGSTTTTSANIKTALSAHATPINTDQSNIDETSTQIGTVWAPNANGGDHVGDMIKAFIGMSDSNGATWDYWVKDDTISISQLGQPIPYFKARSKTAAIDWVIERADIAGGGLELARDIWDLTRDVTVYYDSTPTSAGGSTSGKSDLWTVDRVITKPTYSATPGAQHEDLILDKFEEPAQRAAFTITAPFIRDGAGVKWPLWEVVKQGGGYIRISDLFPSPGLYDTSEDRESVFFITAADYDYTTNTLRIVPDNDDTRLDAVLQRENNIGEIKGEMISRGRIGPPAKFG